MQKLKVAIDGPAGAGKSTIAKLLAGILGYIYIDTGAMYRAITLKALRNGLDLNNQVELTKLTQTTALQLKLDSTGNQLVFLDGQDITLDIRNPQVTQNVSQVSAAPGVRQELVRLQQVLAAKGGVVMDGRDIGTCVLPQAEFKFFLTASIIERARRRYFELKDKGFAVDLEQLKLEIAARDAQDTGRACAPLTQAPDAILIDSSNLNIDQVVAKMLEHIQGRRA